MKISFLSALGAVLGLSGGAWAGAPKEPECLVGSYLLPDSRFVDISSPDEGALRWRLIDGTTGELRRAADGSWASTLGWTKRADGHSVQFGPCAEGELQFDGTPGHRMAFDIRPASFTSRGTTLRGRLVLPKGNGRVPVVVLLHGSEHDSALQDYSLQRMFPAMGIGAFVYDKRGTGSSGGTYTQDFSLLADDAVAATRVARKLAGSRLARIGFQAGSQGGWVAPIAAARTPVDFVIVGFGLAVSVIDEDQEAVEIQLREKGYGPKDIADALEVARAAEAVIASGLGSGFEHFDRMRTQYHSAPWYADLRGDYTWVLLPRSRDELSAMAEKFQWHTPFFHDPMQTLSTSSTRQLWILGGEDYEAPSEVTRQRLELLIHEGRPFTVAYYPRAEHGMTLFETDKDGARLSTRYAEGYFEMMRDFIVAGRLQAAYGDSQIVRPEREAR